MRRPHRSPRPGRGPEDARMTRCATRSTPWRASASPAWSPLHSAASGPAAAAGRGRDRPGDARPVRVDRRRGRQDARRASASGVGAARRARCCASSSRRATPVEKGARAGAARAGGAARCSTRARARELQRALGAAEAARRRADGGGRARARRARPGAGRSGARSAKLRRAGVHPAHARSSKPSASVRSAERRSCSAARVRAHAAGHQLEQARAALTR